MQKSLMALASFLLFYFLLRFLLKRRLLGREKKPSTDSIVVVKTEKLLGAKSDKRIKIDGLDFITAQKLVADFIKVYSHEKPFEIAFELIELQPLETMIIPSADLDFMHFCFLVNYLKYPHNGPTTQKVTGWSRLNEDNHWLTSDLRDKTGMFFLSPNDNEYDRVWFVTNSNENYFIGFAVDAGLKKINEHFYDFEQAPENSNYNSPVVVCSVARNT